MFLEKLQRDIMVAIYVSVLQRMMGFFMRWLLKNGEFFLFDILIYHSNELVVCRPVTNADYPALEKVSESAIKEKQKFERLVVSKEKLLEMFNVRQTFLIFFLKLNELLCSHSSSYSTTNSKST